MTAKGDKERPAEPSVSEPEERVTLEAWARMTGTDKNRVAMAKNGDCGRGVRTAAEWDRIVNKGLPPSGGAA